MEDFIAEKLAERSRTRLAHASKRCGTRAVIAHDAALHEIQTTIRSYGGDPDSPEIVVGMLLIEDTLRAQGAPESVLRRLRTMIELAAEGYVDRAIRTRFHAVLSQAQMHIPPKQPSRSFMLWRFLRWFA